MIFVVLYVYVMYNLSLNYSGNDTKKIKPTVQIRQKVKRLKVRLSGADLFEKNLSMEDSSFVPSDEEKAKGGVSICNEERTYYEEEGGGGIDE